ALRLKQFVRASPHYRRRSASSGSTTLSCTVMINRVTLRVGILTSTVGSVCSFLMTALINVVQVKLGCLDCGAPGGCWGALVLLAPTALLIYIGIVFYAFTR
uniref:Uncharacterized protein n=1 Tax=Oryza brachyantha TaxID=4533 RepID=J3LVJ0_ORYBR